MEKVRIVKDFYEAEKIIKDMFGDSLTSAILLSDWSPKKHSGGTGSCVRKSPFLGLGAGDSINRLCFSYDVPYGVVVKGEYLYRVSRHGIDVLSGVTVFVEYDN